MLEFKDVQGNIHTKCPRCSCDYECISLYRISCTNCDMFGIYDQSKLGKAVSYLLGIKLGKYEVYWTESNGCEVGFFDNRKYNYVYLPMLPFDITLDKLQIYLLFS